MTTRKHSAAVARDYTPRKHTIKPEPAVVNISEDRNWIGALLDGSVAPTPEEATTLQLVGDAGQYADDAIGQIKRLVGGNNVLAFAVAQMALETFKGQALADDPAKLDELDRFQRVTDGLESYADANGTTPGNVWGDLYEKGIVGDGQPTERSRNADDGSGEGDMSDEAAAAAFFAMLGLTPPDGESRDGE